jgi:tripartite-type tricarboxylate transporter receptor subunit TctC
VPAALVSRMHSEVTQALTAPKMRDTMELGGHLPIASAPAEFRRFLESYLRDMAQLSKLTGVRPL